jgi:hypothetical protein
MADKFTPDEVALVERFERLLRSKLTGPVTSLTVGVHRRPFDGNTCYAHDAYGCYFGEYGLTLTARLESALRQAYAANPSEEERKAQEIAALKERLARLEAPTEQVPA